MNEDIFLSPEEVKNLTRRSRSDAQIRALRFMGIEHRVRADNTVAVLREHVRQVFGVLHGSARRPKEVEPDWSAI
ncbi:DUF4224 domain-containing protein [Allopusillimonas soli]|uniref:DUF4224 domain-containing protein n=1 Tax=Allopusillimonas soli TaxID=659016 RepID=A0A853FKM0_9BURK|nr:DUF4224 domain-containing protein [Allopusillimonas soli]NYT38921.1 DUF4224 domain-containing protein [Allopusillimonas soli]TEA70083.1 DUF4224 domain-containing protein [Allopusillimonas soli]